MAKQKHTQKGGYVSEPFSPTREIFAADLLPQTLALIAVARDDCRAAKLLYEARLFPQATFALQQSVEKTVKGIGLASRAILPDELQQVISHKALNVFIQALERVTALARLNATDVGALTKLESGLQKLRANRDVFTNVAKPELDEISEWVKTYEDLKAELHSIASGPKGAPVRAAIKAEMDSRQPVTFSSEVLLRHMFDAVVAVYGLYLLSLATLAHAVASRYGTSESGPTLLYNAQSPLIVKFVALSAMADECVGIAEKTLQFYMTLP